MMWISSAGKLPGVGVDPVVGGEMHPPAAALEHRRQRLGREEMPAGAAGAEENDARHALSVQAALGVGSRRITARPTRCASGRRRVSARIRPMPKATAIIDEPP